MQGTTHPFRSGSPKRRLLLLLGLALLTWSGSPLLAQTGTELWETLPRFMENAQARRAWLTVQDRAFPEPETASPRLRAYWATYLAIEARDAPSLTEKGRLILRSLKLFEGLGEKAPEDLEVHFLRATLYRELPAFLPNHRAAERDVARIADLLERPAPVAPVVVRRGIANQVLTYPELRPELRRRIDDAIRRLD